MFFYGKTAANAIAAMSYLAERYTAGEKASSGDIAKARNLSKPLVAKLLTQLSQAGLVSGSPGPGGGYWLAKKPQEINLYAIVALFERVDDEVTCPFGSGWCGNHEPCPLHEDIVQLKDDMLNFLQEKTLALFTKT